MAEYGVKLAGALLLLLAAGWYGWNGIREERQRLRELEALWELVRFVRSNIGNFARPLPEIYADFRNAVLEADGFLPILREKGAEEALRSCRIPRRDAEVGRIMEGFARGIGKGYQAEEEKLCSYTEERLAELLGKRRGETADREKLYRTIPMMLALSAALILI